MHIFSFFTGFFLITVAPYNWSFFAEGRVPIGGGYGLGILEAFFLATTYFSVVHYGLVRRDLPIAKEARWLFLSLILITLSRGISAYFSDYFTPWQLLSLLRYPFYLVILYFSSVLFTHSKNRNYFLIGAFMAAILESVGGLIVFLLTGEKGVFVTNAGYLIQTFFIVTCLLIYMTKRHRALMLLGIVTMTLSILCATSRAGYIFLLSALVSSLMIANKRGFNPQFTKNMKGKVILILGCVYLLFLFLPNNEFLVSRINDVFHLTGSGITSRFYLWDKEFATFLQNPVVGIGPGSFSRNILELRQFFYVQVANESYYEGLSGHNMILEILSETGLLGFGAYIMVVIGVARLCLKTIKTLGVKRDVTIISAIAVIIACFLSDWYARNGLSPFCMIMLGYVIGWKLQVKREIFAQRSRLRWDNAVKSVGRLEVV